MPKRWLSSSPIRTKPPRDYSAISKKWWEKKRQEKRSLSRQVKKLRKKEVESSKHEAELANETARCEAELAEEAARHEEN
jgi:hypothetical protein